MKYYAGIGSRETPEDICILMGEIASYLEERGWILRSGGADGADLAFENGVKDKSNSVIFLPWKGFNKSESRFYLDNIWEEVLDRAKAVAEQFHPRWNRLSRSAKLLMTRNSLQIFGSFDPEARTKFIVCWTKDGKASGGTGQALRIADAQHIPILNLYYEDIRKNIYKLLDELDE